MPLVYLLTHMIAPRENLEAARTLQPPNFMFESAAIGGLILSMILQTALNRGMCDAKVMSMLQPMQSVNIYDQILYERC